METCDAFWGSHGCSLLPGHVAKGEPWHVCATPVDGKQVPCSRARRQPGAEVVGTVIDGFMQYNSADDDEPADWGEEMSGVMFWLRSPNDILGEARVPAYDEGPRTPGRGSW